MKIRDQIIWASTLVCAHAAFEAQIYLPDAERKASSQPPPSLSPSSARLLIAQRLGLAEYHELGNLNDAELSVLGDYGSTQHSLFSPHEESEGQLLILEGILHASDLVGERTADILVTSSPLDSATQKLAADLVGQRQHQQNSGSQSQQSVRYITTLKDVPRDSPTYSSTLASLLPILKSHLSNPKSTLLLTPPFKHTSASSNYGRYTSPHLLSRRGPQSAEAVLSPEPPVSPSEEQETPSESPSSSPSSPSFSPLPRGVIPPCFRTSKDLIEATNNCSGHGEPRNRASPDEGPEYACFSCRCHATVLKLEEGGTKTTYWGGAACHKKDVSFQFWLLAGLTVALLGIVGWAVGLLVSVGNEELPGVLSAGVAGPRAQK